MGRRLARAIFSMAGLVFLSLASTHAQSRQSILWTAAHDRPACFDEMQSQREKPRRPPRLSFASYFESAAECQPSRTDWSLGASNPRESPGQPLPDTAPASRTELPSDDPIEAELRELRTGGFAVALARQQVLAILRENSACSTWYAQAEPNAAAKLASLHFRLDAGGEDTVLGKSTLSGVYYREPYVARAQENVGAGSTITLNAHGAFFVGHAPAKARFTVVGPFVRQSPRLVHVGTYLGGSLNAQVLTILHEFGHVVGLLPVDSGQANSALISTQNTDTVLQHCRKQIEASAQRAVVLPASLAGLDRPAKSD